MQVTQETGLSRVDFEQTVEFMHECWAYSGVKSLDKIYPEEFTLTRQINPNYGPYLYVTSEAKFGLKTISESDYGSLILQIEHRGSDLEHSALLSGSEISMTLIENELKYASYRRSLPIKKCYVPEAQPPEHLSRTERENFRLWFHEMKQPEVLTNKLLDLTLREVEIIREID